MNGPKVEIAALEKSGYLLEPLENPSVLGQAAADVGSEMTSDNPRGVPHERGEPDNQQERLVTAGWITGFVDGEGCFSIGLVRQPDRKTRKGYRTGYQVSHDFRVTQGAKSLPSLQELRTFFGVGEIYPNRRRDNRREHLYAYSVHKRRDLLEVIIPFFQRNELRTAKRTDFEKFAHCVQLMSIGRHLTRDGLVDILEIAQTMNRQVSRTAVIRILRGHTPDLREAEGRYGPICVATHRDARRPLKRQFG